MSIDFNRMVIAWDENNNNISDIKIVEVNTQSSASIARFTKTDGGNTIQWPDRAPQLFGKLLALGFSSDKVKLQFIHSLTQVENMPIFLSQLLSGWFLGNSQLWHGDEDVTRFVDKHHIAIY